MNTMKPSDKKYTLTKSVDLYYLNEKKCGYRHDNDIRDEMCQFGKLVDIITHYVDKEGNAVEIEPKF